VETENNNKDTVVQEKTGSGQEFTKSKDFARVSNMVVVLLTMLERLSILKIFFGLIIAYSFFIPIYFKEEVKNYFYKKNEYVKINDLKCVSDILYKTQKEQSIYGIELYLFQPKGVSKKFAQRFFSKCQDNIRTPEKMPIKDIHDTYSTLTNKSLCIKDGNNGMSGDLIGFAVGSSKVKEMAYIFKISDPNGGVYGMIIIYSEKILPTKSIISLAGVSKYLFTYCDK